MKNVKIIPLDILALFLEVFPFFTILNVLYYILILIEFKCVFLKLFYTEKLTVFPVISLYKLENNSIVKFNSFVVGSTPP